MNFKQGATKWGRIAAMAILAVATTSALADVKLPNVLSSHMVLQRDMPMVIWGWAAPKEAVTVTFDGQSAQATTNDAGRWEVVLPKHAAGGPFTLTVKGNNTITLEDILVGEVWICSGQSNMEWPINASFDADKELPQANNPKMRFFYSPKRISKTPEDNINAAWEVCSPNIGGFSAAGYYFGKELNRVLDVPVGLINANWGGTRIEPWVTAEAFAANPSLKGISDAVNAADPRTDAYKANLTKTLAAYETWIGEAKKAAAANVVVPNPPACPGELLATGDCQQPTVLYNGMVAGLAPFAIRGVIWYQGESNHGEGREYLEKTRAQIDGYAKVFRNPNLAYYFVQLAPFNYGPGSVLPNFWQIQAAIEKEIPNTGMAVTMDIVDNINDIHPKNKKDVGKRLALQALAKTYGMKDVICSGPTFKSFAVEGDKIRVTFDNIGTGLVSRDGQALTCFEIADAETGMYSPATATIDGATVVLSSPAATKPVAVRFAWSHLAQPNLSNKEGLPAPSFRAGEIPKRDPVASIPEIKSYELVYDLDLAKLARDIAYGVDNTKTLAGKKFDRVAYLIELTNADGGTQFAWTSMDAFTADLAQIGIPTVASKAVFQKPVTNLTVISNVPGIVTGSSLKGNIEFWPHNYAQPNAAKVPGASDQAYDFGDQYAEPADGYGCMQIHATEAKQTVIAINHWVAGAAADLGIGNRSTGDPDWTFSNSGGAYSAKRLRVYVHLTK